MRWLPLEHQGITSPQDQPAHGRGPAQRGAATQRRTRKLPRVQQQRAQSSYAHKFFGTARHHCVAMDDGGDIVSVESKVAVEVDAAALAKATALKDAGNEYFKSTW